MKFLHCDNWNFYPVNIGFFIFRTLHYVMVPKLFTAFGNKVEISKDILKFYSASFRTFLTMFLALSHESWELDNVWKKNAALLQKSSVDLIPYIIFGQIFYPFTLSIPFNLVLEWEEKVLIINNGLQISLHS